MNAHISLNADPVVHAEETVPDWKAVIASLRAQSPSGEQAVDHDWRTIESSLYGHYHFSQPAGAIILDIGVGSGVTAFRFACVASGKCTVYCVVPDKDHRARFQKIAGDHELTNIHFYSALAGAEKDLGSTERKIHFLRIDRNFFSLPELRYIFDQHKVEVVYGEYAEPDDDAFALELYRLCAANAVAFYWYNPVRRDIIAGDLWRGPEVSVILLTGTKEKFFSESVNSFLGQSLKAKEIVIVDDGASSAISRIASACQEKYPGIVYILRKERGTRAAAFEEGLKIAKGRYVLFSNGADSVEPEMLEKLYEAAALYRTEIARCGFRRNGESNVCVDVLHFNKRQLVSKPYTLIDHPPVIGRYLYRRDYLTGNRIQFVTNLADGEELYFHSAGLFPASRVIVLPEPYYDVRSYEATSVDSSGSAQKFAAFTVFNLLKKNMAANGNYFSEAGLKKLQIRTHLEALAVLPENERRLYLGQALRDIVQDNCYVSRFDILRMAAKISLRAVWLVLRACAFS